MLLIMGLFLLLGLRRRRQRKPRMEKARVRKGLQRGRNDYGLQRNNFRCIVGIRACLV